MVIAFEMASAVFAACNNSTTVLRTPSIVRRLVCVTDEEVIEELNLQADTNILMGEDESEPEA